MAERIYNEVFYEPKSYYDNDSNVHNRALKNANEFFIKHDGFNVINIIEKWNEDKSHLALIIYYRAFI